MSDCGCNKLSSGAGQQVEITGLCDLNNFPPLTSGSYWTQISIPTVFNVPQQKLDIGDLNSESISVEIISQKVIVTPADQNIAGGTAENLEGKNVTGRKLAIEGLLCKTINYTADQKDQPVHTAEVTIPFSAYIVLPRTISIGGTFTDPLTLKFKVNPCVEDVFIKEISKRQIFQNVTLFLQAVVIPGTVCNESSCNSADQIQIKGVATPAQLVAVAIDSATNNMWTQLIVSEDLVVPHYKHDIEKINSLNSHIEIISQRVVSTPNSAGVAGGANREGTKLTGKKLIIEGILKQRITYTADIQEGSQPVHSLHFDVPFSAFIVVPLNTIGSSVFKIEPYIEDIFICAPSRREIFKNTIIFIKATKCV